MQLSYLIQSIWEAWFNVRGLVKVICWTIFFAPYSVYLLRGSPQLLGLPLSLEFGVFAVSAALGGLLLNAGLNLHGSKRKETVRVAQEFVAVVVLMTIFLPTLHFVELMKGINIDSFQPNAEGLARAIFFSIAAISFYLGVSVFIVALVDLVYAMGDIGSVEYAKREHQGCSCYDGQ